MKRKALHPVSARKFIALVEESARSSNVLPELVCGVSRATFYRWKGGHTPIALAKAIGVSQSVGMDENQFLSRDIVAEGLLVEKKQDLANYRLLYESFSKTLDTDGQTECLFQVARILQTKLVASNHTVMLTCEQTGSVGKVRIVISRQNSPMVFMITVFGENHDVFGVLEKEDGTAVVGFSLSNKNLRKLLQVLHKLFSGSSDPFDLDTMAKSLITTFHV